MIDINQFSLPHFNAGKAFTTRWDCLNTAYVAAYILEQKKHTPSQNPTPFSHNLARKGIVFDDAEVMSWNLDTRVLST
ncbi:MAG: hypothetical protein LBG59_01055 [Candidatus Peribacteria bacterium]|nr:hypothetical protein [Candidatus Peribacteria bacterium]